MENLTWSATTSVSSVRIILPSPVSLAPIKHFLPLLSFVARSAFARTSISYGTRPLKILCPGVSSWPSSKRVLKTLGCLWMSSGIRLGETVSTNKRKCRIGPLILNICNLSLWSSMLVEPPKNLPLFEFSEISSHLFTAQMEQRKRENDTWEELVKKAIKAEAKVSLLPSPFVRDIDQRCPWGNCPAT